MINVREYNHTDDYAMLLEWWAYHGVEPIGELDMPKVGFLSDNVGCFIVCTDIRNCFIENLIKNPRCNSLTLAEEMTEVIKACEVKAKELKFEKIIALTQRKSVVGIALGHNYKQRGNYMLLEKDL